jgi:anhydro-N-acetylmuramic acid kinase
MDFLAKLKKTKKQRILIVSAGGPQSGIHCMYISVEGDSWETLAHAELPYPEQVEELVETLMLHPGACVEIGRMTWLDHKVTHLFLECAKAALSHAHQSIRQPHCIVMKRCTLFKGRVGDAVQAKTWDLALGDAQLLASTFTDLGRHGMLAGTAGELPLFPGNIKITKHEEPVSVFLNIGLIAHLAIADNQARAAVLVSDVGPGTYLTNLAALEGCPDRFDRDGSFAAQGKVDNNCLTALLSQEWFMRPPPKQAFLQDFTQLFQHPLLASLSAGDKIATLTALTARAAY